MNLFKNEFYVVKKFKATIQMSSEGKSSWLSCGNLDLIILGRKRGRDCHVVISSQ